MYNEDFILNCISIIGALVALAFITFGVILGNELYSKNIEIQDVKQMDDGYYVMIDNRIYYKGVK